jgi:hypothetical protein
MLGSQVKFNDDKRVVLSVDDVFRRGRDVLKGMSFEKTSHLLWL